MDFQNMFVTQYRSEDAGSSRDSSLAPSESDQNQCAQQGLRKNAKNLDRRRESSRYAARDRRGKEADIFMDLKDVAPIVNESTVTHVDRIALLRVASTMCRMRRNANKFLQTNLPAEDPELVVFTEQSLTECLDGFVLLADSDGTILYVSESVSLFLGLTQTDLVGRFLKDFVHNNDYDELVRWSTTDCDVEEASTLDDFGRYLVVRMKTVISPRGRTLNLKSSLYKAILCCFRAVTTEYGRLSLIYGSSTPAGQGNSLMLANSAVKGAETTSGVYMTRHTCDMRFSYISDSLNFLLRHDSRSLMSSSFFDLVHPSDLQAVSQSFRELFKKSHCRTPFYRLLGANSSVVWAQTEATTVNHTARGQKGQYVLCVHSIVGMQSEAESWAKPIAEPSNAANPALCTLRIKREIDNMIDYMGRQPEFVECVDFTPLIDPISDVNFNDFNPVRSTPESGRLNARSQGSKQRDTTDSDNAPSAKQKRKKSFDDVLKWLVRDEADSPPPAFTDPNFIGDSNEDVCITENDDPNLAFFNRSPTQKKPNSFRNNFNTSTTTQRNLPKQQSSEFTEYPARSFGSGNQQQLLTKQQWQQSRNLEQQLQPDPTPATALARRASTERGTAPALPRRQYQRGGFATLDSTDVEIGDNEWKSDMFTEQSGQQRYSRYDIHQEQRRRNVAAIADAQHPSTTRTVSALSTASKNLRQILPYRIADSYIMSPINQRVAGRQIASRASPNIPLHSALCSARASTTLQRAPRSSSNNNDTSGDDLQFIGEFYGQPLSVNRHRSRSNSSTTSVSSYDQSAIRRYSIQNPSSPALRRPNIGRSTEPRQQRPLNVNQLNEVPTQFQQQHYQQLYNNNQTFNGVPNFYYAARNKKNILYHQQQQSRMRSEHSCEQIYSTKQDDYASVPAKRAAFGCDEPIADYPQSHGQFQCKDLSRLAPFVPGDDLVQLEDLNFETMYSDFDFSEYFPSEMPCNPPPVIQQTEKSTLESEICNLPMTNQNNHRQPYLVEQSLGENWAFEQY